MKNYFNTLSTIEKMDQLSKCRFMNSDEFDGGVSALLNKKIVIIGCGAQGLNQGLNMRDSGLDISYSLRKVSIEEKRQSFLNATNNGFTVGTYEELIPDADLVLNLTPDKQHTNVVKSIMHMMKKGSTLSYSHGFNIVEEGMEIRKDITVIMVAPKCPGTEVREEYKRGFGVPTLIAVHPENDSENKGLSQAKAYAVATGGHKAGVLESSFVAEVKSDLMGEQTILCGVLQTASILLFDKMINQGLENTYAAKLIQNGWEVITEELKHGGITKMMNRLSDNSKIKAFKISEDLNIAGNEVFLNSNTLLTLDNSNNLIKIDLNGKVSKKPLPLDSKYLIFADNNSSIYISENILTINKKNIEMNYGNYSRPTIFLNNLIQISSLDESKIYLFKRDGSMIPYFPIFGTSNADITKNKENKSLLAVTGEKNEILVYSLD